MARAGGDPPEEEASTRRRGRPSHTSAEETRRRVFEAARHAFATQGFSGATMRGIAADADLTAMALYNYAPSKTALFEMVWQESIETIYTDYEAVVSGRQSLYAELEVLLDRSREVLIESPDHVRFVMRMLMEREHGGLAGVDFDAPTATDFLARVAERAVRRGEIAKRDRARLTTFISTLLWGITALTAHDPTALDHAVDAAKWAARRQLAPSRLAG